MNVVPYVPNTAHLVGYQQNLKLLGSPPHMPLHCRRRSLQLNECYCHLKVIDDYIMHTRLAIRKYTENFNAL